MEYIYAALLLHKLGKDVNEENLKKVVAATGVEVDESKVKTLIASLKDVDITSELEKASIAVAAPSTVNTGEAKPEAKKEEEKPSESAAGLASLFG